MASGEFSYGSAEGMVSENGMWVMMGWELQRSYPTHINPTHIQATAINTQSTYPCCVCGMGVYVGCFTRCNWAFPSYFYISKKFPIRYGILAFGQPGK